MRENKLFNIQDKDRSNYGLDVVADKFLILYIYASTVAIIPNSICWWLRYASYLVFMMTILVTFVHSSRYYYRIVKPAIFTGAYVAINMLIFMIYSKNLLSFVYNIKYLFFILFVFLIPVLGKKYSLNRYIKHFFLGILVQSVATIVLILLAKMFGYESIAILSGNIDLGIRGSSGFGESLRVFGRLNALFVPCVFYFMLQYKKGLFAFLALFVVTVALYYTKSIGLYVAFAVGFSVFILAYFKVRRSLVLLYVLAMFVILNIVTVYMPRFFVNYPAKYLSALIKSNQILDVGDLPRFNLFFGYGHGYVIHDRIRNIYDVVIEVLPAYWIFVSGLLGLVIIFYLFLYPLFDYKKYFFMNIGQRKFYRFIIASQVAVFFSGIWNSYLLSGSTAFFLVFFYCYFIYERQVENSNDK